MNRKWWVVVASLVALAVVVAIGIPLFTPPTPGVTYANYSRLEKGMSREQVKAILGEPSVAPKNAPYFWENESGDMVWIVHEHGLVKAALWNGMPDHRTALEKLRDRFPLLTCDPPPPLITR